MMKIALTNLPPEQGETIARLLVEEHLVACVNSILSRAYILGKEKFVPTKKSH